MIHSKWLLLVMFLGVTLARLQFHKQNANLTYYEALMLKEA